MPNPAALDHLSPAYPGRAPWGTAARLRAWQAEALQVYRDRSERDFLAVATPGAGKTTFALRIASDLLAERIVKRVIVVTPTEHLKVQWADAAARAGVHLDPGLGGGRGRSRHYHGKVVTYAGVAAAPYFYETLTADQPTLVVFDEIHHAGDSLAWGDGVAQAFGPATRRLALTGTPFRCDDHPIPFVRYHDEPDGSRRSAADYVYSYAEGLRDNVVRPVVFFAYGGGMRWRTRAGDELEADLTEPLTKDLTAQAWRTALDPHGQWIASVLTAADRRLTEVRRHVPDAGGLVIAGNQKNARAYAKLLHDITGEPASVVLSDDPSSSDRIDTFAASAQRWMVAVRMVSEGVDVPRLAVGVYATSVSTPLFFAQAIGRFVRSRRRGELASVFLPTVPHLLLHARSIERQRDHVLGRPKSEDDGDGLWSPEERLLADANREQSASDLLGEQEALDSYSTFDHILFDAQEYGLPAEYSSREEAEYLGLPGLLEPEQVRVVLRERQRRQLARQERQERRDKVPEPVSLHRALKAKRSELNRLVSQLARVRGIPHSHVHAALRREAGGPALAQASAADVDRRIALAGRWLAQG
ncbi:DEAD/DEAH box helicase [Propionicicella superfundia]|uniref:DEAD/DEAH box helicase n=1 Tax=Propionicicella superfundia TaxID=348582 RepID=UPI00048D8E20|nr:DEAD/DEAH box helicase [Propionicicella superfundia]